YFFFSSRRRHTRFSRDWSSDVCSSDLSGVSVGPEEKKMGIKGSSTRTLILDEAQVPVENVLGEIGKGHVIAFNILNLGRFKLGRSEERRVGYERRAEGEEWRGYVCELE